MNKIFFVTSRNVINTSGELRLIKNRAIALEEEYGIATEFYVLASRKRFRTPQEAIGHGSEMHIFQYQSLHGIFLQAYKLCRQLVREIGLHSETVVVSGFIPTFVLRQIKQKCPNVVFYQDIHGATEELLEYGENDFFNCLKRRLKYLLLDANSKNQAKLVDGMLVVSNALKEHCALKYKMGHYLAYVIPCGGLAQCMDLVSYQKHRDYWRNKMGIDDSIVFIYSGGVSPWQSIEETVELYLAIRGKIKKKCTLVIMSNNLDSIKKYASERDEIQVKSFRAEVVNSVLCCGDVGFLLRNESITNKVAFPNKYYEYLLAGLYIVCSSHVADQAQLTEEYQVGLLYKGMVDSELIQSIERCISGSIAEREQRINQLLEKLSFQKSLETFAKKVME